MVHRDQARRILVVLEKLFQARYRLLAGVPRPSGGG